MKKILLVLGIICAIMITGCTDETQKDMEKFLHDRETYSPELFVEMADTYEGTLDGEHQQRYVFDLRSEEDYEKGHIIGAVNVEFDPKEAESFIEKIPDDWSVYIVGNDDAEAKVMRESLKEIDEHLFVYVIEGGYEALSKTDGIEKYITTEPGDFSDFTRTEAEKQFNEIVDKTE